MPYPTQSAISFPDALLPGNVDNYVSNEVIASGLTTSQVWPLLSDTAKWTTYYSNAADITPPSSNTSTLSKDAVFKFSTFGFPAFEATVKECVVPGENGEKVGRLAWYSKIEGKTEEETVEVYHAWLVEDLEGGRVRILTQEVQKGGPARELAKGRPNKMLLGHQDWLDGLVVAARGGKVDLEGGNLKAAGLSAY